MTQPTGGHTVGAKLMSAYIDVDVRVSKGIDTLKDDIKSVETQAETTGKIAGAKIVDGLQAAASPAGRAFGDQFHAGAAESMAHNAESLRGRFFESFLGNLSGNTGWANDIGKKTADQMAEGMTSGVVANLSAGGFSRPVSAALRNSVSELEPEAHTVGQRVGMRMMGGMATAIESMPGIWSGVMSGAEDVGRLGEAGLARVEAGLGRVGAAGEMVAGKVRGGMSAISGATMGLVSGPMAGLMAAVTTVGGAVEILKGGFERLESFEAFEEKMHALGATAQQTKDIISSLQSATAGTAFRVPELLGLGQDVFMRNNMSTTGMIDYVKNLENVSAVTGESMDGLDAKLARLHTRGYATMRELGQFTAEGLPVGEWFKSEGVGTGGATGAAADTAFAKFAAGHGVTFDMLMGEISKHTTGAAADMSKGIGAQTHIMGDNLNQIGASVIAPFFGQTGGFLQTVNTGLSKFAGLLASDRVQSIIKNVGDGIGHGFIGIFDVLKAHLGTMFAGGKDIISQFIGGAMPGGGEIDWHKIFNVESIEHGVDNFVHAAGNVEHALGNVFHAEANMFHAAGNVVHALENVWHAGENVWHALGNVNHALHNVGDAVHATIVLFSDTIPTKIDAAIGVVVHFFEGLPDKIGNAIGNLGDKIGSVFSHIIPHGEINAGPIHLHYATGGMHGVLPGQAGIQSPVGAHGLVQWAEPSTGGEAFIPLSPANRDRSTAIWLETGKRLGLIASHDTGGITPPTGSVEARVFGALDKFASAITKVETQFNSVAESVQKLKGGDLGGLDGLNKTLKDVTPQLKTAATTVAGMSMPDGLPTINRPTLPSVRNLRPGNISGALSTTGDIAHHANDLSTALGYQPDLPGLGVLDQTNQVIGGARELASHGRNIRAAWQAGDHGALFGHAGNAANTIGNLANTLGVSDGGVPAQIVNSANNASLLHDALRGAGALAARAPILAPVAAAIGDFAAPVAAGVIGGKEVADLTEKIPWVQRRFAQGYDLQGEATNPVEHFAEHIPLLGGLFRPSDDVRLYNARRAAAAAAASGPALPPELSAVGEAGITGPRPRRAPPPPPIAVGDAAAFAGFGGGGFLPGYSEQDNLLGHIPGVGMFGLAGGEGIIKTRVAQQPWVKALVNMLNNGMPGYQGGTAEAGGGYAFVGAMAGTPYSQGERNDCSGMASQVINSFLGLPPRSSMFTTRNEGEWLMAHGFKMGMGPPGSLRVGWYNHGSAPDDGHTAVTLPDGTPVESGGSHGNFMAGGGAAGADAAEFDQHAYLPPNPQGPSYGGIGMGAGSPVGGTAGGGGGAGAGGGTSGGTGGGGGGAGFTAADMGSLADIGVSGLKENMVPGFSDPTQWSVVKSGAALFKFLGALGKSKGMEGAGGLSMIGDIMSGSGSGMVADMASMMPAGMAGGMPSFMPPGMPGAPDGMGLAGGDTTINNDHSQNFPGATINDPDLLHKQATAKGQRDIKKTIGLQGNTH